MGNLPIPSLADIKFESKKVFHTIDKDFDQLIDIEEYHFWLENNFLLQDFLVRNSKTQTVKNGVRCMQDWVA